MKKFLILISLLALIAPSMALASQFQFDAAISEGSVSFSPANFFAGETVRVYANIINLGTNDITGGVSFFQGAGALGAPSFFSLKANGANEDVWIDWTPIEGTYNIMVKIETNTTDQNPSNNGYVTPMKTITKRPPPPPPVSQPVVQAPVSSQSSQGTQLGSSSAPASTASAGQNKATLISIAEQVAATLTPKLPVNPSVSKSAVGQKPVQKNVATPETVKSPLGVPVAGKSASVPVVQQQVPKQGVLGESVARGSDPVQGDINAAWQKNEKEQGFGLPSQPNRPQRDPVRTALAISVFLTLLFLGVGFYFLKISRA